METAENKKPVVLLSHHFYDDVKQLFMKRGFHTLLIDQYRVENEPIEVIVKEALLEPGKFLEKSTMVPTSLHRQYVTWLMNIQIDAVIEWQRGRYDFPLLKMYQAFRHSVTETQKNRSDKEPAILPNLSKPPLFYLCLNWNGKPPDNWEKMGYYYILSEPFYKEELKSLYDRVIQNLQQGITGPGLPEQCIKENESKEKKCDDDPYREIDEDLRNLFRLSHLYRLAKKREDELNKQDE